MKKFLKLSLLAALTSSIVSCYSTSSSSINLTSLNKDAPQLEIENGDEHTLEIGSSFQLDISSSNLDQPIQFYSEDDSIAEVSETGVVSACNEGSTHIYAFSSSVYDSILITVIEPQLVSIEISISQSEIEAGSTLDIDVTPEPLLYDVSNVSFSILSGQDCIEIEGQTIFAKNSGTASIQGFCGNIASNIIELRIYDFQINLASNFIEIGDHERIKLVDYHGTNRNNLYWKIDNENIVSLKYSATGDLFVNGLSKGSTYFYLYDTDGLVSNSLYVEVIGGNPYIGITQDEFYSNYERATSYTDAMYRSECNLMSGWIDVPDQEPVVSSYQPESNGKLIHNLDTNYSNMGNTYTVVDAYGEEAFDVYYGAAYTSLEEVAAYIYAWGDAPINYSESKNENPQYSPWGEYLRLNNNEFYGDTSGYPYEPELPDIYGCGGNLIYYEIDIGTTGTDCDPNYPSRIYNDGNNIARGAARIVYSRYYADTLQPVNPEDRYVFYTYNHYNDFQEYLNYENGWGEIFGNITGGGAISSMDPSQCSPTPYVETIRKKLP